MRLRILMAAVAVALGCGAPAPELPAPDFSGLPPAAAADARERLTAFEAEPNGDTAGRLAALLHAYERWDAATAYYDYAARKEPDEARWPYLRAVVEQTRGHTEAAQLSFKRAIELDPTLDAARFRLAELLRAAGRSKEAETVYAAALEANPGSATAYYGLGVAAAERGDDAEAARLLETALARAPGYSSARYALAQALRRLGETARAAEELEKFENAPKIATVFYDPLVDQVDALRAGLASEHARRGKALLDEGRPEAAVAEFQLALEADPGYAEAHVNLMSAHGSLGEEDKAEQHYRRAVELGSDAPELHYNLGVLRVLQGRDEEAVKALRKALERNPNLADAAANLGFSLERLGWRREALAAYQRALEAQPDHRFARFHLARNRVADRRHGEALPLLEGLEQPTDPLSARVLVLRAQAQAGLGRNEAAAESLAAARRLAERFEQTELLGPIDQGLAQLGPP